MPVLPSSNITDDLEWYATALGFHVVFADEMYAAVRRDNIWLHLQWHAGTSEDPLLGGSVIRIFVTNIQPIFEELVARGAVVKTALRTDTPWRTHEFGVRDPNKNAIFFVEDLED